jgi:tyrosinase
MADNHGSKDMGEHPRAGLSRRDLLVGSAAALGANMMPSAAQAATFRRFEISDPNLPANIIPSYQKAISAMLALPPTDPRNWYRNAFKHISDCPHGNWWFVVWHRGYIGWFERICRELSGDDKFSLPYWDWTKTPRIPAAMFQDVLDPNDAAFIPTEVAFQQQFTAPVQALFQTFSQAQLAVLAGRGMGTAADFIDAAGQSFFDQPNARGLTAAHPDLDASTKRTVALSVITSALRTPTFAGITASDPVGFASAKVTNHSDSSREGILESQPHDNVHGAIGGPAREAFMMQFLSPVDPIFFLHHANIDRLWDIWTRRQTALQRPTLPQGAELATWSGEQFLFFSDEKGNPVSKITAGDYASMSSFDYDYSPGSGEDEVPTVVAAAPAAPVQSFSANITSSVIGAAQPAGGQVTVPSALLQAARPPHAPPRTVEVSLDLAHGDQGRRFRVVLSPHGGSSPIELGAITVFNHHPGPTTFTLPLPDDLPPSAEPNAALDIRVLPIEAAATPAGGKKKMLAMPSAPPKVTAIQVRTP